MPVSKCEYAIRTSDAVKVPARDTQEFLEGKFLKSLNDLGSKGYRVVGFASTQVPDGAAICTAVLELVKKHRAQGALARPTTRAAPLGRWPLVG